MYRIQISIHAHRPMQAWVYYMEQFKYYIYFSIAFRTSIVDMFTNPIQIFHYIGINTGCICFTTLFHAIRHCTNHEISWTLGRGVQFHLFVFGKRKLIHYKNVKYCWWKIQFFTIGPPLSPPQESRKANCYKRAWYSHRQSLTLSYNSSSTQLILGYSVFEFHIAYFVINHVQLQRFKLEHIL